MIIGTISLVYNEEVLQHRQYKSISEKDKIITSWKKLYSKSFDRGTVVDVPITASEKNIIKEKQKKQLSTAELIALNKSNYTGKSTYKKGSLTSTTKINRNKGSYKQGSRDFGFK